jgi:Protein of unknown function (DUF3080)
MDFTPNPTRPESRTAATPGWLALLLGCALLALLPGCAEEGPDAKFENYLNRLGRTLAVAPARVVPRAAPVRPSPGSIRIDAPASKLDTLDFLALSGCDIQVTIGKRNSSLGRMARASQRLLLDLEYLRLAPACSAYLREQGENMLADTLDQAWELKRRHLPAMIFNATLGSEEYRKFWKRPALPGNYPANTGSAVITALGAINNHARRWLTGDFLANNREFETLLGEVARGDGGALLQALAGQAAWLASANQLLQQRLAQGPLCSPGRRPAASDILENVIRKYFIGDIQPWSAAVGRRYHELLSPIAELEQLLGATLPPPYRNWQIARNAQLTTMVQAPRLHVEQLQLIRQPCTND